MKGVEAGKALGLLIGTNNAEDAYCWRFRVRTRFLWLSLLCKGARQGRGLGLILGRNDAQ